MTATKVPVTTEKKTESTQVAPTWEPIDTLRKQIDRVFDDFGRDFWRTPLQAFSAFEPLWSKVTGSFAVDVTERDKAYEITAELPGMDEKNVEVKVANGGLTIKGEKKEEKKEEKEEKKQDYFMSERRYGSFERYFRLPEGVDTDKIEANFKKGVLTVTLPKKAEAQKPAKKVEIKAAA